MILKIGGKKVELPSRAPTLKIEKRPGGWLIAEKKHPNGKIERFRFSFSEKNGRIDLNHLGKAIWGEWQTTDPSLPAGAEDDTQALLTAQFPGKVRKVFVQAGDNVKQGQKLLVVEAMKVEFEIKAPHDGRITRVGVKEEQQLSPGDRFVELEK